MENVYNNTKDKPTDEADEKVVNVEGNLVTIVNCIPFSHPIISYYNFFSYTLAPTVPLMR
jgi:hypothetical protein